MSEVWIPGSGILSPEEAARRLQSDNESLHKQLTAAQQEIELLKDTRIPLNEHNRIVEQTIVAIDGERTAFEQEIERLRFLCIKAGLHGLAPCPLCGYNGPGFFQSDTHACVRDEAKAGYTEWDAEDD